jgi:hypothetical protein
MDSNKHRHETKPLPEDFILIDKDIQNKSGQSIGWLLTEERAFRKFFGTTAVVIAALELLVAARYDPGRRDSQSHHVGPLLHEGVPEGRFHLLNSWWFGGCHQPQNPTKFHLAIHPQDC